MGNREGGIKARDAILKRLGSEEAMREHYRSIGKKGGSTSYGAPRGFAAMPREKVSAAGAKGGRISRRPKKQEAKQ